ncbi:MAG TPA: hypothetical protein DEA28_03400 [Firmicutes bacterium]|nr:hypothetical protein [Bacillota bacterium]
MSFNASVCSSSKLLEEIKDLIKDKKYTQEEFAKEIGYSRKAFNRLVNYQNKNIDFNLIIIICKKLGIKAITID